MKALFLFFLLFQSILSAFPQEKVSFYTSDSLKITADLYLKDPQLPFIILLHQSESSRGEYNSIAPKLLNLGYNCLAVDLRSGKKMNYILNETAERAKIEHKSLRFIDAQLDIDAAIQFVRKYNHKHLILFGSSYSASLALIIANKTEEVDAVVAFSPGEYFLPEMDVRKTVSGLNKPIFAASTDLEYNYVIDLLSEIPDSSKTIYRPSTGRGFHGAKALWDDSEGSNECWLQLAVFFGKLKEI
jgi:pimeloyl-ACP methyl ester carboxylesterase